MESQNNEEIITDLDSNTKYIDSKCPNCGNELKFLAGSRKLKCEACESTFSFTSLGQGKLDDKETDYDATIKKLKTMPTKTSIRVMRCQDCGGLIHLSEHQVSVKCPYCDSNRVVTEEKIDEILPINGVIPFAFDEKQVYDNFKTWINKKPMAPLKFKKGVKKPTFSSLYVPFYTFDSDTFVRYSGDRGTYYYVTVGSGKDRKRVRKVRWRRVSGTFRKFFDDVLVTGTNNILNKYIRKASDFNFTKMEAYQEKFLLGYYTERPSLTLDQGFASARSYMYDDIYSIAVNKVRDDTYRDVSVDINYSNVTFKLIMAPIYNGTYVYGNKKYNFIVNGQTGTVAGKSPVSPLKVSLLVILGLIILAGIIYLSIIMGD